MSYFSILDICIAVCICVYLICKTVKHTIDVTMRVTSADEVRNELDRMQKQVNEMNSIVQGLVDNRSADSYESTES